MKKWNVMLLALALLMLPAACLAEDLPDFLSAVYTSVGEGLEQGAMQAMAAMDQELTLEMTPSSERIEEGQSICLTIKAGNPRPKAESVKITLDLPKRLTAAPDTVWEAELPAAQIDPETGLLTPSETVFMREIALAQGGDSETAQMTAEMSMGTRFYRAKTELALCVPDVSAKAAVLDVKDGRVQPGDAFAYQVEIVNAGTAAKDVDVKLLLPAGVTAAEPLPAGFTQTGNTLHGHVRAEAAGEKPGSALLTFPVRVNENALANEADALRLLAGALHVDGKRVALPRVEVCGAKISAALMCSGADAPCLRCEACRKVMNNVHPDIITVADPEKKRVPVDLVRQARADIYTKPNEGKKKIYLFPQELGLEGQNALLKILEEPPQYGVFLLLTDNPERLLPTVRSRCVELALRPLENSLLRQELRRQFPDIEEETLTAVCQRSGGYLGQAIAAVSGASEIPQQTVDFVNAFAARDVLALVSVLVGMEKSKRDVLLPLLEQWVSILEEALASRSGGTALSPSAQKLSTARSSADLLSAIREIQKCIQYAQGNVSPAAICGYLQWALR